MELSKDVRPAGVMIFTLYMGKFLLILRDDKPEISFPNSWSPVTGGIEAEENVFMAAKRELIEEIGVIPENLKILGISAKGNGFFFATLSEKEKNSIKLGEGQEYDFFTFKELSKIDIKGAFHVYLGRYNDIFKKMSKNNYEPRGKDFELAVWNGNGVH
jgi:8-oxo-dGTP diphosphatase